MKPCLDLGWEGGKAENDTRPRECALRKRKERDPVGLGGLGTEEEGGGGRVKKARKMIPAKTEGRRKKKKGKREGKKEENPCLFAGLSAPLSVFGPFWRTELLRLLSFFFLFFPFLGRIVLHTRGKRKSTLLKIPAVPRAYFCFPENKR